MNEKCKCDLTSLPSLDETELRKLAMDYIEGRMFTNEHVRNPHDLPAVFMPLLFLSEEEHHTLRKLDPGLLYESTDNACPVSVNGMPTFWSVRFLSKKDTQRLGELVKELRAWIKKQPTEALACSNAPSK